jgi:hypothetical protein
MNGELRSIKDSGNDLIPGNKLDFKENEEHPLDQGRDVTGIWRDIIKKTNL